MRFLKSLRGPVLAVTVLVLAVSLLVWYIRPPAATEMVLYTGERDRAVKLPSVAYSGPHRAPDLPAGYDKIAADGYLSLFFHEKALKFAVADHRTGYVWYSSPPDADKAQANALFKDLLNSLVRVRWQVGNRNQADISGFTAAKKSVRRVDGGVVVSVEYQKPQIGFDIEVLLKDGGLEVAVPWESVKEFATRRGYAEGDEKEAGRLLSITPVPFFGAAPNGTDGYLVLPDGSGAIMYFRERPHGELIWQDAVYGGDLTFRLAHRFGRFEQVYLPLYGIVRDGHAVASFIVQGDTDAAMEAAPAGQAVAYNRIMAEWVYRKNFEVAFSRSRRATVPENDAIPGDRRQRFVFLAGQDASYVGVGAAYRDYLVAARAIKPLTTTPEPVMIRLFGGVNRKGALWDQYVPMTRTSEARRIVEALQQAGVREMKVVYEAWQKDGYGGDLPDRFPPDRRLGGEKGMREFVAWAREQGIPVVLEDDYLNAYNLRASSFSPRTEAVRNAQGLVITTNRVSWVIPRNLGKPWYLVNPAVALDDQVKPAVDRFREWGASGVEMAFAGERILSSYRTHPVTRNGHADIWYRALQYGREQLGSTGVRGGNGYTIGAVDYVWGAPLDNSRHWLHDEPIPLLQIVLRSIVPYYSAPGNLRDDRKTEFLRMIEYGALPAFTLTAESPAEFRDSVVREFYSGRYTDWVRDVVREYQVAQDALLPLFNQRIIAHGKVVPKVYQTTYEDGTIIVVNYGAVPHDIGQVRVEPESFAVIKDGSIRGGGR